MFNNQVIAGSSGQGGGFYDFPIEQSLRFNDNDSAYLSRTPASAGNRKTWTWSGWVKRGNLGLKMLFTAGTSGSSYLQIRFDTNDEILCSSEQPSSVLYLKTTQVFRDPSAWYHIVVAMDTTQSTAADRTKLYINGSLVTDFSSSTRPAQNTDLLINSTTAHMIGALSYGTTSGPYDGYMADVNFIDGTALDASSFGETKSGIWVPVDTADLTFGTNGFRLQFGDTTEASGFNTVTYTGNQSNLSINGCGFSPDLVWIKSRTNAYNHELYDTVRGVQKALQSSTTNLETTETQGLLSFDSDGFSLGSRININEANDNHVAWAWDAGSGSPASNTDGDITSTVKANTDYGFSITSYTGDGTSSTRTIGCGLNEKPDVVILKNRTEDNVTDSWFVYHIGLGSSSPSPYLTLYNTDAVASSGVFVDTAFSDNGGNALFAVSGSYNGVNKSGTDYIAYCFAEKTGYSKFGTYSGTGAAGNSITLGFKPAFLLIKETGNANSWELFDNTRNTSSPFDKRLFPNDSAAEATTTSLSYSDTGFETLNGNTGINRSGGTYIYMAFADTRDAAFWKDTSGEGNDWQPNNLVFSDVVPDSATNNFCTISPLMGNSSYVKSEGNTKVNYNSASWLGSQLSTMGMSSGKYYWEVYVNSASSSVRALLGIESSANNYSGSTHIGNLTNSVSIYSVGTNFYVNGSGTTDAEWVIQTGDTVMFAYDADNGTLWIGKGGTWWNSATAAEISAGTTTNAMTSGLDTSLTWLAGCTVRDGGTVTFNFGQDSTFANNTTAGGNVDANGYGDFKYAVPSGLLSLNSANLPSGAIDTLNDETPEDYFNTLLWTGDGSNPRTLSGLDFAADLIWHKSRSSASMSSHAIQDVVRGFDANNNLYTNLTGSETDYPNRGVINSVSSTGFTFNENASDYSTADGLNQSGVSFVAWNWKAGGTGVSNTDGSITSTVSASETSQGNKWFSVVKWTGNATAGATVGHGLTSQPRLIITKNMDVGTNWSVLAQDANNGSGHLGYIRLDLTAAWSATSILWNNTEPTSSVFTLGSYGYVNGSGQDIIGYCFANAEGLCKVGKYGVGTGDSNGPFVYTGFRPAFILVKRYDGTANWGIWDNERLGRNPTEHYLVPDLSNAEGSASSTGVDFLSNGFKFRGGSGLGNLLGANYIYIAIAEQPFKYANAR